IVLAVFWDAFETLILPRRVARRVRLTRILFHSTWWIWQAVARGVRRPQRRENFLSFYGPLSILFLLGGWAFGMIPGFAVAAGAALGPRGAVGQDSVAIPLRACGLWAAELRESPLSSPLLALFRSQHDNQSWVAALTVTMDACALIFTGVDGIPDTPARLTF